MSFIRLLGWIWLLTLKVNGVVHLSEPYNAPIRVKLEKRKQDENRSMRSNSTLLHPVVELFPLTISLFLLIISRLRFSF